MTNPPGIEFRDEMKAEDIRVIIIIGADMDITGAVRDKDHVPSLEGIVLVGKIGYSSGIVQILCGGVDVGGVGAAIQRGVDAVANIPTSSAPLEIDKQVVTIA